MEKNWDIQDVMQGLEGLDRKGVDDFLRNTSGTYLFEAIAEQFNIEINENVRTLDNVQEEILEALHTTKYNWGFEAEANIEKLAENFGFMCNVKFRLSPRTIDWQNPDAWIECREIKNKTFATHKEASRACEDAVRNEMEKMSTSYLYTGREV